ncbi:RNA polymerase sigma factor [Streptomyces sp. UNOC14_S4]|uniref:RNA polymerase sigma factor n=1 Tax=Streptomyces sp. UNOC14_S4 TaxID=2872340 RepID=UPI001E595AB5|nr:RNA polymerase sigma factor [Streptomyces sp. UNOC14_S4]MCC3772168.1 RNA polymerase sigma factor [Streptomyces sp. UNOC14_S4]
MSAKNTVLRTATPEHQSVVYESFVLRKRDGYVKWALWQLHSMEDARDAANEALFRLYLRWDDALASASADAYGFKILRDTVVDMLRKRDRRPSTPIGLAFQATVQPIAGIPDEEIEQVSARLELHHAVAQLPERQRTCIALHYLMGHTVEEVADITGITDSTVRSHLSAGRTALAALLDPTAHEKGHPG